MNLPRVCDRLSPWLPREAEPLILPKSGSLMNWGSQRHREQPRVTLDEPDPGPHVRAGVGAPVGQRPILRNPSPLPEAQRRRWHQQQPSDTSGQQVRGQRQTRASTARGRGCSRPGSLAPGLPGPTRIKRLACPGVLVCEMGQWSHLARGVVT